MEEKGDKSSQNVYGGEYCRVHIRVHSEAKMGQTVAVSGSTYQLGYFDPEKVRVGHSPIKYSCAVGYGL